MLQAFRDLLKIIQGDPAISSEIPIVRSLALRTFRWLIVAEFIAVLQFYPVKLFMDELGQEMPQLSTLMVITAGMTLLFVVTTIVNRNVNSFRADTNWRVWRCWWGYGHRCELRLSSDFHKMHGTGEKESLVGKNINKFEVMIDEFIFQTFPATLRIAFASLLMFFISWQLGLVAIVTIITFGFVMWRNEKRVFEPRRKMQRSLKRLERFGTEITNNWATIKSLGLEEEFSDRNEDMLLSFVTDQKSRTRLFSKMEYRQSNVVNVSRTVLYATVAWLFVNGQISIGSIVLATMVMERALYLSFQRFSDFQRAMNEGVEALRELIDLIRLEPTVKQAEHPVYPKSFVPSIEFRDVSFAYPDEPDVEKLSKFSLKVPAFTTTAITGQSGGGKSTVVSLLLRDYDPTKGKVLVSDKDLSQLDYHRYRQETVSVVSQSIQLFDDTILNNIRLAAPNASDQDCIEAAKQAHAHEFIAELKDGYSTLIGENGVRLSGGQRQRLAIARALVRKPLILVLDEATSALDPESQAIVQQTLDELTASRKLTIFIIAHRFSTIVGADQVVVMEKGQMREFGTHAELDRRNGLYTKLRSMEASGLLG